MGIIGKFNSILYSSFLNKILLTLICMGFLGGHFEVGGSYPLSKTS